MRATTALVTTLCVLVMGHALAQQAATAAAEADSNTTLGANTTVKPASLALHDVGLPGPFDDTIGFKCSRRSDCGYLPGLACVDGKCEYCRDNNDCSTHPSDRTKRCYMMQSIDAKTKEVVVTMGRTSAGLPVQASYCIEKDLFSPFTPNDVIATIVAFLSTALGSGCGVGGGGLLVPLYIFVIGLSPKHAIPLSKATIFGNAIAIYIFNLRRKHPTKPSVPIINYAVAAIMEPPTLIGAIFGVMMNHMFPNWLILLLLLSLLSYITYRTFLKGNKIREKESKRNQQIMKNVLMGGPARAGRSGAWSVFPRFDWEIAARHWLTITRRNQKLRRIARQDEEDFKLLPQLDQGGSKQHLQDMPKANFGTFSLSADDSMQQLTRQRLERMDAQVFPLRYILPLVGSWLVVLVQAFLRGGHGSPSIIGVACNSSGYWMLTFLPMSILVMITLAIGYKLRLQNRLRVLSGYSFAEGDIHWTKPRVITFPAYCVVAGVAAGLLGIGGGMVKGPIMLEMGILPPVQSATASFMIMFTSSSTTLLFAIAGQFPGSLQYDYVAGFTLVGFLGGLCGQKVVAYCVKKYKRESIMVHLLAVTIGLSAICMGIVSLRLVAHDVATGVHLGFSGICGSE
ncbi:TPA: hypothetical protein N0F65_008846 [Lagenidium giganteum]|uniref:Sulfite exporter TauE/SafE n=1 Tax=Lagenidium giganteum TaxID=4803 RepID=A0AAV2YS07_9STRA|nr:TPA: hypothetical protein N0F65_008846 [Lagenidium giganteum]